MRKMVCIHLAQEKEKGRFVTRGEFLTSGEPSRFSVGNCDMESPLFSRCVVSRDVRRSLF